MGEEGSSRPWWVSPVFVVTMLSAFGIYSIWAALQADHFCYNEFDRSTLECHGPYLSPFYSPLIVASTPLVGSTLGAAVPGPRMDLGIATIFLLSPALLILWMPVGFRLTCYYYRKAYHRSFLMHPPGCAVNEVWVRQDRKSFIGKYDGETKFFLITNLHRYFFYFAFFVLVFLWYDTVLAFWHNGSLHVGVGSILFLANVILLSMYSLSCHSFRHLLGGWLDGFSRNLRLRMWFKLWRGASFLNERHMEFAWCSLITVMAADMYVRLLSMGVIRGCWDAFGAGC
jgi:hypothetical protein